MNLLMGFRVVAYFIATLLPLAHPAALVFGDVVSVLLRFVIVPGAALLAFLLTRYGLGVPVDLARRISGATRGSALPARSRSFLLLVVALVLLPLAVLPASGGPSDLLSAYSFAAVVAVASFLAFGLRWFLVLSVESLALLAVCYRYLDFSRANPDIAASSQAAVTVGFVALCICFFVQSVLVYRALFPAREGAARFVVPGGVIIVLLLLGALVLPKNYADHQQIANSLENILTPPPGQVVESNRPGLPGRGNNSGENGEASSGRQRTKMVMVVRTNLQPLYLAEDYFGPMDAIAGFVRDQAESLNSLFGSRKIETWRNPEPNFDMGRQATSVEVFSTIPGQALAYLPLELEPTVYTSDWSPMNYNYSAVSAVSLVNTRFRMPRYPAGIEAAIPPDILDYARTNYTEATLEFRSQLLDYLARVVPADASFDEKIEAILGSFSTYQYEIGFTDDVSVAAIEHFLFHSHTGDCTEFSNAAVLMARELGIPARVVTGWAVSEGLQTDTHRRALQLLQERHQLLAELPLNELYLVTDAHHHSWAQFWLPDLGWVDFETTATALPPPAELDASNFDIVIPELHRARSPEDFAFPWQLLALVAGSTIVLAWLGFLVARAVRYGRLAAAIRRRDSAALRALYKLLLLRLAHRGFRKPEAGATPLEYAEVEPRLQTFAELYTRAYYAAPPAAPVPQEVFESLLAEYGKLLAQARSLRGQLSELLNPREPGGAV